MKCKCGTTLVRRQRPFTKSIGTKQQYVFREWDFCPTCKHIQHYNDMRMTVADWKALVAEAGGDISKIPVVDREKIRAPKPSDKVKVQICDPHYNTNGILTQGLVVELPIAVVIKHAKKQKRQKAA